MTSVCSLPNQALFATKPIAALAPAYPDPQRVQTVQETLSEKPALVSIQSIQALQDRLGTLYNQNRFMIQAGYCAEVFSDLPPLYTHRMLQIYRQALPILKHPAAQSPLFVGRMAGQFAKPRSQMFEHIGRRRLPTYYGDMINGASIFERTPDPQRMLRAYQQSWEILCALKQNAPFEGPLGFGSRFFTGHEAYLLPYERGLCRQCPTSGKWYGTSSHFLWVGERTRQPKLAHIQFIRNLENPVGVKIGPTASVEDLKHVYQLLNPHHRPGKLTFIFRLGRHHIQEKLPIFLKALKGKAILWVCDPLHGNTQTLPKSDLKIRWMADILAETTIFFTLLKDHHLSPAGLHCEVTSEEVTECLEAFDNTENIKGNYTSACDPRLNKQQFFKLLKLCNQSLEA